MKKTIITLTTILFFASPLFSQIVNIPDDNFLNALIDLGIDTNEDGQIDSLEAIAITTLAIHHKEISDLTGIEAFLNLDSLNCSYNDLTSINVLNNNKLIYLDVFNNKLDSIDVSNNLLLEELWCDYNKLDTLDVSENLELKVLYCSQNELAFLNTSNNINLEKFDVRDNQLFDIDISKNVVLEYLNCGNTGLTILNISNQIELTHLYCDRNSLTELNISNNKKLSYLRFNDNDLESIDLSNQLDLGHLYCHGNQISELDISNNQVLHEFQCDDNLLSILDISNNPELRVFYCRNNQLKTLELEHNPKLELLNCENNQLTELNIYSNNLLEALSCGGNFIASLDISPNMRELILKNLPSLVEVCVWELPFPPANFHLDTTGSPNVEFTMDCTPVLFVPETIYQTDSIEVLCTVDATVYLVPENTGNDLSEIYENKIDSLNVLAGDTSNFYLNGLEYGTYWFYAISDSKKISEPEEFSVVGLLGLEVDNSISTRIYPNPAGEYIIIDTDVSDRYSITISSLNGQMLYNVSEECMTHQIDLSSFQKGVYFITIRSKAFVITEKFIKL